MTYVIKRAITPVPLEGDVNGTPWERARVAQIDTYPWDSGRKRESATVRALYDAYAIYLQFHVKDSNIAATTTKLNGPVYEDSAVEWFASPLGANDQYFNFEINCVGTVHLGWGPNRSDRTLVSPTAADHIQIGAAEPGPTRESRPDDSSWWLTVALPFVTLCDLSGLAVAPSPGVTWQGNFQRLGTKSEFAVWSHIDAPKPDFHRPAEFDSIRFVDS